MKCNVNFQGNSLTWTQRLRLPITQNTRFYSVMSCHAKRSPYKEKPSSSTTGIEKSKTNTFTAGGTGVLRISRGEQHPGWRGESWNGHCHGAQSHSKAGLSPGNAISLKKPPPVGGPPTVKAQGQASMCLNHGSRGEM